MAVENIDGMNCKCLDCTWHGVVGDCDMHHKWSYIICPECASSRIAIVNRRLFEEVETMMKKHANERSGLDYYASHN